MPLPETGTFCIKCAGGYVFAEERSWEGDAVKVFDRSVTESTHPERAIFTVSGDREGYTMYNENKRLYLAAGTGNTVVWSSKSFEWQLTSDNSASVTSWSVEAPKGSYKTWYKNASGSDHTLYWSKDHSGACYDTFKFEAA